jgi:hypothetical protein
MPSDIGYSATIGQRAAGTTGPFLPIPEVINITPPSIETELVDATHLTSPNRLRTYKRAMRNPSDWTFEFNFLQQTYSDLLAIAGTEREFELTIPESDPITFRSIITNVSAPTVNFDLMRCTVTCRLTSEVSVG